jgi:hypothetical protein
LKSAYRKFYAKAFKEGGTAVVEQVRTSTSWTLNFSSMPPGRMRVRADLAADRLIAKIENDLKSEWARHIGRKKNIDTLLLQTQEVFKRVKRIL